MRARLVPRNFPRGGEIEEAALDAAVHLGLTEQVARLQLVLDAPEFEEGGYWLIETGREGVEATLYSSPRDVLTPPSHRDRPDLGLDEDQLDQLDPRQVDLLRLDRWLHRNLLQLGDILHRRIDPGGIPRDACAAFQICWDVWTDGRLKQRALPGISLAERRRHFFRRFASVGMLLPQHWRVFHALWEGRLAGQEGLLEAVRGLPPLPSVTFSPYGR